MLTSQPSLRMRRRLLLGCVLLLSIVASGGCGGGDSQRPSPQRVTKPAPSAAAAASVPAAASTSADDAKTAETPANIYGEPDVRDDSHAEKKSQRDDDVSTWKMADYFSAKEQRDRRLLQAVQYIAENEKFVGNEKVALVLRKLLTAEEPEIAPADDADAEPPRGRAGRRTERQFAVRLNVPTIEAIITALAANGSEPANQALRDVVLGTLKTDNDVEATKNALQALADDVSEENEAVLFQALTEAEKLRPEEKDDARGNQGDPGWANYSGVKLSADYLRQMTLELVENTASEDFRAKLAQYSLESNHKLSPEVFAAVRDMLMQSHPNNVGPQLLLFESSAPSPGTKALLASFFTEYSETALGHLLGVSQHVKPVKFAKKKAAARAVAAKKEQKPATAGWGRAPAAAKKKRQAAPKKRAEPVLEVGKDSYHNRFGKRLDTKQLMAIDETMPSRIVKKLWSPEVVHTIGDRLAWASSLKEAGMVIPLARTMPVDAVRGRLYQLLQKHWKEGSTPFLSSVSPPDNGFANKAFGGLRLRADNDHMDLGLAMSSRRASMFSSARSKEIKKFKKPVCDPGFLLMVKMLPVFDKEPLGRSSRGGGRHNAGTFAKRNAEDSRITDWYEVQENLLYHLIAAFQVAARLDRRGSVEGELPIELHSDAPIETRYDLKWPPSDSKESALPIDPLEVHYVKIVETEDPSKVWKFYNRELKTQGRMLQRDRVALLDTVRNGSTPGSKLSLDVLITRLPTSRDAQPQTTDRKGRKNTDEPLAVEILTIEMKDPSATAGQSDKKTVDN